MLCLNCESEDFALKKDHPCPQIFRNRNYDIINDVMVCKSCGFISLTDEQADDIMRKTWESYKKDVSFNYTD